LQATRDRYKPIQEAILKNDEARRSLKEIKSSQIKNNNLQSLHAARDEIKFQLFSARRDEIRVKPFDGRWLGEHHEDGNSEVNDGEGTFSVFASAGSQDPIHGRLANDKTGGAGLAAAFSVDQTTAMDLYMLANWHAFGDYQCNNQNVSANATIFYTVFGFNSFGFKDVSINATPIVTTVDKDQGGFGTVNSEPIPWEDFGAINAGNMFPQTFVVKTGFDYGAWMYAVLNVHAHVGDQFTNSIIFASTRVTPGFMNLIIY
jgi:hypothetical protein